MFVREFGFTITEHDPDRPLGWFSRASTERSRSQTRSSSSSGRARTGRHRAGACSSTRGRFRRLVRRGRSDHAGEITLEDFEDQFGDVLEQVPSVVAEERQEYAERREIDVDGAPAGHSPHIHLP